MTRSCLAAIAAALVLVSPAEAAGPRPCPGERPYPGDGATRPAFAVWMASVARTRLVPGELPVMAALELSNMRNLGGDRDSVGFFQMRVGVWERSYPGYATSPEVQLRWFLDRALAVLAGGPTPSPSAYGSWIADVERPEGQYTTRYQLRLAEARGLIRAGCGGSGR